MLAGCIRPDNHAEEAVPDSYMEETGTVSANDAIVAETVYEANTDDTCDISLTDDSDDCTFERIGMVYQEALEYFTDLQERNLIIASELADNQNLIMRIKS